METRVLFLWRRRPTCLPDLPFYYHNIFLICKCGSGCVHTLVEENMEKQSKPAMGEGQEAKTTVEIQVAAYIIYKS